MKRFIGFSTLAAVLSMAPGLSGYQFYDTPPPKWGGGAAGTPSGDITWLFDSAGTPDMAGGDPVLLDGEFAVLIGCLQDWESATNGNLDLHYIGTTSAAIVTGDGNHIARWEDVAFPSFPTGPLPGGVIGICTFDYTGSSMTDADVEFNGVGFTWSDAVLMKKVALHEFGHAIAFAHESATVGGVPISAGGVPVSIMYPSVSGVTDLTTDDEAGAVALYGFGTGSDGIVEGGPPPPPPPFSHPPRRPDPVDPSSTRSPNFKSSNHNSSSDDDDDYGHGIRRYKNKYCVVATAASGSENASRVDALRAMRDRSLQATQTGASVIGTYENAAAPVAQVVKQSEVLRALVRGALSR